MHEAQQRCIVNNRDIVIVCASRLAAGMGQAFQVQLAEQALPASVIWFGISAKYQQGIVVLEWEGEVPSSFVQQLEIDTDIIDYMLYEVPTVEGESIDAELHPAQIRLPLPTMVVASYADE